MKNVTLHQNETAYLSMGKYIYVMLYSAPIKKNPFFDVSLVNHMTGQALHEIATSLQQG